MQRIAGLFDREMDFIRKQTWYRQRFDACPHFMFFVGQAHHETLQKTRFPWGQKIAFAGFSKNRADWYHSLDELSKTAEKIMAAARTNPNISAQLIREFKSAEAEFYLECHKLRQTGLSKLTDQELLAAYDRLAEIYLQKLNSSGLIDGFALSTDTLIASKIREFLEKNHKAEKFVPVFETLTSSTFLSFLQLEELALLRTVREIKQNPSLKESRIQSHAAEWFWIQNNYVKDNVLGIDFFAERFERAIASENLDTQIKKLESFPDENRSRKEDLMQRLDMPDEIRVLLRITDDFTYWQDERKKGTFWATHFFSLLLTEFSRRSGYSMDELKYCLPPEMPLVLDRKISKQELKQRFEYCMVLLTLEGFDVLTDPKRILELDSIGTGKHSRPHELRGFTACLGTATGIVRIVESVDEIHKVREGDILVAVMTRPDYMPAMKKAAAIVTDEGGITCHAAIVARELQKPCIIGTKLATKILKDGDLVSVRANHGVVSILQPGTES